MSTSAGLFRDYWMWCACSWWRIITAVEDCFSDWSHRAFGEIIDRPFQVSENFIYVANNDDKGYNNNNNNNDDDDDDAI